MDTCPLCEQPIERSLLLARIDERIRADEHIARLRQTATERRKILLRPLEALTAAFLSQKIGQLMFPDRSLPNTRKKWRLSRN
jgi:DNA-binding transcriptional MocR family regulator